MVGFLYKIVLSKFLFLFSLVNFKGLNEAYVYIFFELFDRF